MKNRTILLCVCVAASVMAILFLNSAVRAADEKSQTIDWNYAQQLYNKATGGQTLTPEENSYLEKAKTTKRKQQMKGRAGAPDQTAAASEQRGAIDWSYVQQLLQRSRNGQPLSTTESAYLDNAKRIRAQGEMKQTAGASTGATSTGLVPLDQMTAQDKYKGEDGGLYGGGKNEPPAALREAAKKESAKIVPLDADGKPARDGKIVLLSIGMSNTTQEFSKFKQLADADDAKSPQVVIVDGAQGGMDAARWNDAASPTWNVAEQRLKAAGVTAQQVEAVWMKHARIQAGKYGEFPKHAEELKGHFLGSLNLAKEKYPNLRIAYLSGRIYAGYASTPLNPEPYAYESAFVVRALILDQMKGDPKLNYDPSRGEVVAPLLLWGPYLWGDGLRPRKSDGLIWKREDLGPDGTHPSPTSGREKVARLLLDFLKSDPCARGWFLRKNSEK
jgi:hypothetical protein